jgi:hypothetical protein
VGYEVDLIGRLVGTAGDVVGTLVGKVIVGYVGNVGFVGVDGKKFGDFDGTASSFFSRV